MPTPKKTPPPAPPAAAVAQDAHWAATQERLRNRTRPTATLTICDDVDIKTALESARYVLRRAKAEAADLPGDETVQAVAAKAEEEFAAAQANFDSVAIALRFQALPRRDFEAMKKAHPATEEQAEDGSEINIESIAPELISAASTDGITVDDAQYYLDTWSEAEAATLFNAAWGVNETARMDLGKG